MKHNQTIKQVIDALLVAMSHIDPCDTDAFTQGNDAIQALREYQGEWISVEDKPVPIDEKAMLCFPLSNGEHYICSGYIALEDGCVWADSDVGEIGYPACDISHWQPLPEPPMNKGDE
jgi:hypothetical protein